MIGNDIQKQVTYTVSLEIKQHTSEHTVTGNTNSGYRQVRVPITERIVIDVQHETGDLKRLLDFTARQLSAVAGSELPLETGDAAPVIFADLGKLSVFDQQGV